MNAESFSLIARTLSCLHRSVTLVNRHKMEGSMMKLSLERRGLSAFLLQQINPLLPLLQMVYYWLTIQQKISKKSQNFNLNNETQHWASKHIFPPIRGCSLLPNRNFLPYTDNMPIREKYKFYEKLLQSAKIKGTTNFSIQMKRTGFFSQKIILTCSLILYIW